MGKYWDNFKSWATEKIEQKVDEWLSPPPEQNRTNLHNEDRIQFISDHRVSLLSGDYELTAKQILSGVGETVTTSRTQHFSVAGERFELHGNAIHSYYPPKASRGNYGRTLPHVMLHRSTLPWERSAEQNPPDPSDPINKPSPWLALLLFDWTDPPPSIDVKPVSALGSPYNQSEIAQSSTDQVKVITVPSSLIDVIPPIATDLNYLTHVRRRLAYLGTDETLSNDPLTASTTHKDILNGFLHETPFRAVASNRTFQLLESGVWLIEEGKESYEIRREEGTGGSTVYKYFHIAHETAAVVANRLPKPGGMNTVHLVSLESWYNDSGNFPSSSSVELVSLMHWEFYCESAGVGFTATLNGLNHSRTVSPAWRLPLGDTPVGSKAASLLQAGMIPLRHRFRNGNKSISFYRGPLVEREPFNLALNALVEQGSGSLKVRHADELLIYDSSMGMFDVSYAAAWELGRMLTLKNTNLALKIQHWKQAHRNFLKSARHLADYGHDFPVNNTNSSPPDTGRHVNELGLINRWLDDLALLKPVPFNYLVPDARLLPAESLRFFTVDPEWIKCLRDGAFSLGRVLVADTIWDRAVSTFLALKDDISERPLLSGFLLRSKIVAERPNMHIVGYERKIPDAGSPNDFEAPFPEGYPKMHRLLRRERLSEHVLLCLYEGEIHTVDFFLSPETLHFGFQPGISNDITTFIKKKRNAEGVETTPTPSMTSPYWNNEGKRIINVSENSPNNLVTALGVSSTERFAMNMIAGAEFVRFSRNIPATPDVS